MEMKTKYVFLAWLLALAVSQTASAVPTEWGLPLDNCTVDLYNMFDPAVNVAQVACTVYQHDNSGPNANQYIYTYRVTNTDYATLSFFSVTLSPAAAAEFPAHDTDGVVPLCWDLVNSPPDRVEAIFKTPVAPQQYSALLWFFSDYPFDFSGQTALSGMSSSSYVLATADGLITPVPEPATVALLGLGALTMFNKRRSR